MYIYLNHFESSNYPFKVVICIKTIQILNYYKTKLLYTLRQGLSFKIKFKMNNTKHKHQTWICTWPWPLWKLKLICLFSNLNHLCKLQKLCTWGDIVASNDISNYHKVLVLQQLKVMLLCSKCTYVDNHFSSCYFPWRIQNLNVRLLHCICSNVGSV